MQQVPAASVEFVQLDLAHLDSVQRPASRVLGRGEGLDLLVNNAGGDGRVPPADYGAGV